MRAAAAVSTEHQAWTVRGAPSAIRSPDLLPRVAAAVVELVTRTLPENPERVSEPRPFRLDPAARVLPVVRVAHRADVHR